MMRTVALSRDTASTTRIGFVLALVLLSAILVVPARGQSARAEQVARALAHVQAQEYDTALTIFRELIQQNPQDYEARIWVARLLSWKGNHREAEELYRAVLDEQPQNKEAEMGLVDVIAWQGRHQEAMERLQVLYARDPRELEVLLRLGRFSRWRGDRKAALRYYREARVADPSNQEAQDAYQILIDETNYRLEAGYWYEDFNFTTGTHAPYVELLYTDHRRLTLLGRVEYQRKFAADNTRFSFGATRKFGERTWLRGEVGFAPGSDVLARQDYQVEVSQQIRLGVTAGTGYRFLTFGAADAHALTVLTDWDLRPNLHISLRYLPARTRFDTLPGAVWNHSGWARLTWDASRSWSPYVVFAVGSETFSALSADLLGRFAAQTYGFGTTVHIRQGYGFRIGYLHQKRTQGRRQDSLTLAYFMRF